MAAISIRNLDEDIKQRLRVRAARNGRSMESEVRAILAEAVNEPDPPEDLFSAIADRFAAVGGVELDVTRRSTPARAAELDR